MENNVTRLRPNQHPRMTELALSFPSMRHNVPGIGPWDAQLLEAWTAGPAPSHGGLFTVRFLLAVWQGRSGTIGHSRRTKDGLYSFPVVSYFRCGPFDIVDALGTWDYAHRAAFFAWAKDPWWP